MSLTKFDSLCIAIVRTQGNLSTADVAQLGYPFEVWLRLATHATPEELVRGALRLLYKAGYRSVDGVTIPKPDYSTHYREG